jgi:L-iditol 2-dehydrogenase
MLPVVRALILHGPGDLRLEEVPEPEPGPGEIVVAVDAALTCATDAKMARNGAHPALGPLPAPLGHELAGTVVAVGAGVDGLRPGEAVVPANSAPCGTCPRCAGGSPNLCERITHLTGAFAERLLVPAAIVSRNTHRLPEGLDPVVAAMAEPLACAVHTAERYGDGRPLVVVVLGGGVQGTLLTALLTRAGHRVHLADPHPERRERALRFGAAEAHEPGAAPAGADLVLEAVGRPESWAAAVALARPGGEVVFHGGCAPGTVVGLPAGPLHYQELTLRGSYHHTPDSFRAALELLSHETLPVARLLSRPIALHQVPDVLAASRGDKHPVRP